MGLLGRSPLDSGCGALARSGASMRTSKDPGDGPGRARRAARGAAGARFGVPIKRIGHAFARLLSAKRLVVGQDMRTHSPEIADAVSEGMRDAGCNVVRLGLASTPMVYYGIGKLPCDGGLAVTASHNPKEYIVRANEEVDELKSNVIALLNHESNTPLQGILLTTEMLLEDEELSSRAERVPDRNWAQRRAFAGPDQRHIGNVQN